MDDVTVFFRVLCYEKKKQLPHNEASQLPVLDAHVIFLKEHVLFKHFRCHRHQWSALTLKM